MRSEKEICVGYFQLSSLSGVVLTLSWEIFSLPHATVAESAHANKCRTEEPAARPGCWEDPCRELLWCAPGRLRKISACRSEGWIWSAVQVLSLLEMSWDRIADGMENSKKNHQQKEGCYGVGQSQCQLQYKGKSIGQSDVIVDFFRRSSPSLCSFYSGMWTTSSPSRRKVVLRPFAFLMWHYTLSIFQMTARNSLNDP